MANSSDQKRELTLLLIGTALFVSLTFLTNNPSFSVYQLQGISAQLQVVLSLCMIIYLHRPGYYTAMLLNTAQALFVALYIASSGNTIALPGIIVPLTTMLTAAILAHYIKDLNARVDFSLRQQDELKQNAIELNRLAYYDQLTGMLNRESVIQELNSLSTMAKDHAAPFALVFIDMDNFKDINDTMGHHIGDELLQIVSKQFMSIKHPDDILGRLGGDEFALLIKRPLSEKEIYQAVSKYRDILASVTVVGQKTLSVSASFGVALLPKDTDDFMELITYADTAMYRAKVDGKNRIQFFNREMKETLMQKVEMEHLMQCALQNQELHLVFQPQFAISGHTLLGFEALCRWQSPVLGAVSPAQFIPLAEINGMIYTWGLWIIEEAIRQFMRVMHKLPSGIRLSINLSVKQIMEPDFVNQMSSILHRTGIQANCIELEITESLLIANVKEAQLILNSLKTLGFRLALDDFGTGYSSLHLLQQLPIDTLKIDKVLIDHLDEDEKTRIITAAIIRLAQEMGIHVIAEGVESESQLAFLKANQCASMQGYLWGKPSPLSDYLP